MAFSRREFIKIGVGGVGALALGSGITTQWWGLDRHRPYDPDTEGDKVVPTFCELCFWKCGVLAHVKEGVDGQPDRVTKIEGNPNHPLSRGRLCPRGTGGTGLLYDLDRLKKPLVRVKSKNRGEQAFEAVSWETALDEVAEQMGRIRDKYGAEALALFSHGYGGSWFKHLVQAYGSNNIAAPSYAQCRGPREVGYYLTFGNGVGSPESIDMENARCITLIGSHLGENMHNTQVQEFADALASGAELVVVMAVGCFIGAEIVERIVNERFLHRSVEAQSPAPRRFAFATFGLAGVAGLAMLVVPVGAREPAPNADQKTAQTISVHALAGRILDEPWKLRTIDLRSEQDFIESRIPGSENATIEGLSELGLQYSRGVKDLVLVGAEDLPEPPEAAAAYPGKVFVLQGGFGAWRQFALDEPALPAADASEEQLAAYRFQAAVHSAVTGVVAPPPPKSTVKFKAPPKRSAGGCR